MNPLDETPDGAEAAGGVTSNDARERGTALLRLGQFVDAAQALREAVTQNPDDETGWRLLGGALASQGDHASAVTAFERAVELAPTSPRNHYNLAVALQATGRTGEARGHLEQAVALEPDYAQARATLEALDSGAAPPDTADQPVLRSPVPEAPAGGVASPYPAAPPAPGPYPPPGAWPQNAPPPLLTGASVPIRANANGVLILIFGILGLIPCCNVFGPVAWIMGNQSLKILSQPMVDQSERGMVTAGRICGIIGTVFLLIGVLFQVTRLVFGVAAGLPGP
jgi:thioredoxin-like negative regulator of GroEL